MKIQEILEAFDPYLNHDPMDPNNTDIGVVKDVAHMVEVIGANCSEMVAAYQSSKKRLYRGMREGGADSIITAIRPDRKPLYMPGEFHDILHRAFLDLGLKATRTNSVFCTTKIDTAEVWGRPYVIFIKDGWSGTVFSKVRSGYAFDAMEDIAGEYCDSRRDGKDMEVMLNHIRALKPTPVNNSAELTKVLNDRYEDILITGDSYIGLWPYSALYREVAAALKLA